MKTFYARLSQATSPAAKPVLPPGFDQGSEAILERMHVRMEQFMAGESFASTGNEQDDRTFEPIQPNLVTSLLLFFSILSGTLLLILTGF